MIPSRLCHTTPGGLVGRRAAERRLTSHPRAAAASRRCARLRGRCDSVDITPSWKGRFMPCQDVQKRSRPKSASLSAPATRNGIVSKPGAEPRISGDYAGASD
jgi:hypothetical protein